jgi:hypothetical protein
VISLLLSVVIFFVKKKPTTIAAGKGAVVPKEWLVQNEQPLTPKEDRRPADQTFLTFPEWYLVFSPEEQAKYFKQHTATTFPFMSHTAQIWESYKIVNDQIKGRFPVNKGYHFMIWVIGSSSSVEYAVKSWYEKVVGRITDTQIPVTDEDQFNAGFTQQYVDFIKDKPWYQFDFTSKLKDLWTSTSLLGDHIVRKWERKYWLTSELLVKIAYGKLIGLGTQQVYEEAIPSTAVILENDTLVMLPRYDKFSDAASDLANKGHSFKEVAGNNSAILVTLILPNKRSLHYPNTQLVFTQPNASDPSYKRIALAVPVSALSTLLQQLKGDQAVIEHVFDY